MTNYLLRLFASAFARRIAFVVVAIVLAWCGIGRANAATVPITKDACTTTGHQCTQAEARTAAEMLADYNETCTYNDGICYVKNSRVVLITTRTYRAETQTTVPGSSGVWSSVGSRVWVLAGDCLSPNEMQAVGAVTWKCQTPCAARANTHMLGYPMQAGDAYCFDGCEMLQLSETAGGGQAPMGATCAVDPLCEGDGYSLITLAGAPSKVCRPTDTDGDGIPDDEDEFPDDPDEGSDSDGDGIGDNDDSAPNDPDNGEDTEGDEDGDDEGDNSSTGGGSCNAAPNSSGDGLLSQIAFQAWKTRCAIERVTTGNSLRTTGEGGSGVIVGDGDGDGELDEQQSPNPGDYLGDGSGEEGAGAVKSETEYGGDGFDDSGFGWSRSCPNIPAVSVFGYEVSFASANTRMCDWLAIGAYFVMLLAMIQSLRVLMSA